MIVVNLQRVAIQALGRTHVPVMKDILEMGKHVKVRTDFRGNYWDNFIQTFYPGAIECITRAA